MIERLLTEEGYVHPDIPANDAEQRTMLRGLLNTREAAPIDENFLEVQDEYLQESLMERGGAVDGEKLPEIEKGISLWQGDITRLRCDAVVNAANSGMTGCYVPCHACIDNCIHTFAGVQLRKYCADLMKEQGYAEPVGEAKITPAFNLPCRYVIHTVGPNVRFSGVTARSERELASCYESCLRLAAENDCASIALCCISTGEFGFPRRLGAEIAVRTARKFCEECDGEMKIIFNVFKDEDLEIYRDLLGK